MPATCGISLARRIGLEYEPASCINYVTELCSFESDDGRSQLRMIDCANREVSVWEDRLNTTYAALMAKAAPKARDGYRKMQRGWIAYRDARCAAEASAEPSTWALSGGRTEDS